MLKYILDSLILVDFHQTDNSLTFAYTKNNNKQLVSICISDDYPGEILKLNYFTKMREREREINKSYLMIYCRKHFHNKT